MYLVQLLQANIIKFHVLNDHWIGQIRPSFNLSLVLLLLLSTQVWMTVFLAAIVVCACTMVILKGQSKLTRAQTESGATGERCNMDKVTALGQRSFLWTMSHLISQPVPWEPTEYAARVIGGLWLLVAFVLGLVYRGNLKAMLILPKVELPFNSLKELADSDVPVWSPGSHIAFQMIMAAPPDSTYGLIAKRSYAHLRVEEGIRKVYEGKQAIICLLLAALDSMDKTFSRVKASLFFFLLFGLII
ncbi:uncharacterized protein LOC119595521 [Penaeus monodon]|uniref:uncharacterized protein LOC119595521 n=1 Tax=Penaeus monodon TaxID=6687 RepID=UPI0018A7AEC9|nr:uncharacterized protein LOC119595521 [Penaeus monodon]